MERLPMNKGDPWRRWTYAAVSLVVLLPACVIALSFSAGAAGWHSHAPAWRRGGAIPFLPSPAALRKHRPGGPGLAGRICITKGTTKEQYCPTPPLLYLGGAGIQESPKLYLILWGKNWISTEVGSKLGNQLVNVYQGISGSSYQGILTQYFDTKGRVGTTLTLTKYVDTSVTAPTEVNDAKIQAEVSKAISVNGWTREFDAEFIVATAPGSTFEEKFGNDFPLPEDFCGYHDVTTVGGSSYTFLPYLGDAPFKGCSGTNPGSKAESATTSTATHEYAESVTDPNPNNPSWVTSDRYEIGDICAKEDDELAGGLWVQGEWDNFQGECSLSDASPAFVYSVSEAATELGETTAVLNGTVNPESVSTEYLFEYGTNTKYGSKTATVSAGSGRNNVKVKASLTGLKANTTYHFRLAAKNAKGTANGLDKEFKTT